MKLKAKVIAVSTAAMLLSTSGAAFAENGGYSDVTEQSPYYDAITYLTDTEVFTGVSETEFAPKTNLTRGMFVTLLGRVYDNLNGSEGAPESAAEKSCFKDVKTTDYYCAAINWAFENGIVNGYSDELFAPDDILTKEQAIAILYRYSKYSGDEFFSGDDTNILSYEDFTSISQYAIPAVQWGLANGIIDDNGSTINADENVTREKAAQYLYNYTEKWLNSRDDSEVTE